MSNTATRPGARQCDEVALWSSLAICMGIGPLMLYSLTAVSPLVIAELGLSSSQYGAIATVTFGSAALSAVLFGKWVGAQSGRVVMVWISIGSAVGLAILGLSRSYLMLVSAAVVCGVAQAFSNSATNRVVVGLSSLRRGALIGWKQSGVQMAQLTAGLLAPAIAVLAGWRWIAILGITIAAMGVVSALGVRPSPRSGHNGDVSTTAGHVSIALLTAYTFFMGFGLQATNAYLPLFAHLELELSASIAGLTAAVVGCVGLVSRIWWARSSARHGLGPATLFVLALGSAIGVTIAMAASWIGAWLVWVGAGVFGAAALASNAVMMVALVRAVPDEALGAATAVVVTGMYGGFAAGPVSFGLALDHGAGFGLAWLLPLSAFFVAALIGGPSLLPARRTTS